MNENDENDDINIEDLSSTFNRHFAEADHIQKWDGESLNETIARILSDDDVPEYSSKSVVDDDGV